MHEAEPVDVILADWRMPRMDGLELCRRTRAADDDERYTYFVFMTSFADREHFIHGLEAGADDYQTKPIDLDELRARLVSAGRVVELRRRLAARNAELRSASERSFHEARLDALTQIANRFCLEEDLKVLWARSRRYGHHYSLAICDVDRFKSYNDHFGHLAGDDVLRRVAQALKGELREGDGIYRYGGEEFVVLLPEQPLADAERAIERLRAAVHALALPAAKRGAVVTISFGVAELDPSLDDSFEDTLRRADAALYRAKAGGRNRVATDRPR